jgi:NAD(P)-dependent dehydrogenase (short-subunit alcohol dehydrogenase family)
MSQATLEALALTLSKEEKKNGIHVNIVAPGLVETEMGRKRRKRALRVELHLTSPDATTRPGAPVEVVGDWHPSHWGTQLLELRDPDGRVHFLEHGSERT